MFVLKKKLDVATLAVKDNIGAILKVDGSR